MPGGPFAPSTPRPLPLPLRVCASLHTPCYVTCITPAGHGVTQALHAVATPRNAGIMRIRGRIGQRVWLCPVSLCVVSSYAFVYRRHTGKRVRQVDSGTSHSRQRILRAAEESGHTYVHTRTRAYRVHVTTRHATAGAGTQRVASQVVHPEFPSGSARAAPCPLFRSPVACPIAFSRIDALLLHCRARQQPALVRVHPAMLPACIAGIGLAALALRRRGDGTVRVSNLIIYPVKCVPPPPLLPAPSLAPTPCLPAFLVGVVCGVGVYGV